MASAGRVIVSNSKQSIGLHLMQWQTQPSASLAVEEAEELVRRLQKAIGEIKAARKPAPAEDDFEDIA